MPPGCVQTLRVQWPPAVWESVLTMTCQARQHANGWCYLDRKTGLRMLPGRGHFGPASDVLRWSGILIRRNLRNKPILLVYDD